MPGMTLRERLRRPLLVAFPIPLAVVGAVYYLAEEPFVSTDDAFVRAAQDSINEIAVKDNQRVRKGQLLFRIDPEPYRIAVAQAEARLGSARIQIDALKATYHQQLADLQAAKDSADFAGREYDRQRILAADQWASREASERAETDFRVARQRTMAIAQQIANTVAALNGDPNIDVDRHPTVREAQAHLDQARLDYSYSKVLAPDDGVVTRVDDLQLGDYVNTGATLFWLLSSRRVWIEANFRETGLTRTHPGQPGTIDVDTYPGRTFNAHVVSMSPGTGSDFAVLPPENATGNWVKVVQRLPVRLELDAIDPDRPLFSGISVTVEVDTGYRSTLWNLLQTFRVAEAAQ